MGRGQRRAPERSPPASETAGPAPAAPDAQDTLGNAAIAEQLNAGAGEAGDEAAAPDSRVTLDITESQTTWAARGSLDEIGDTIAARQAGAHVGWRPRYSVTTSEDYVNSVTLTVPITKEMPVWRDRDAAPASHQAAWDTFAAALGVHEQGHVDRARTGFQGVGESMLDFPEDTAGQVFARGVTEVQSDSDTYDATTGHGRTQGAVLTTPAAAPAEEEG